MGHFSASDAAIEGFNVIRARWRVVVGWGVFNLIALVGVLLLMAGVAVITRLTVGADDQIIGVAARVVYLLAVLFVAAVFVAGLYRLMLRPEQPSYLHLRFGGDEARLYGVWLIQGLVGGAIIAAASWAVERLAGVSAPAQWLCGLAGLAALFWLGARFSLLGPVSFAEKRISFARSWRLTRGRTWALIGMWLLLACLCGVVLVGVWLSLVLVTGALTGFDDVPSLVGLSSSPDHLGRVMLQLTLQTLLAPAFLAICQAPLMAAYQALAGQQPEPAAPATESFGGPWG